jgi:hypothetical protein
MKLAQLFKLLRNKWHPYFVIEAKFLLMSKMNLLDCIDKIKNKYQITLNLDVKKFSVHKGKDAIKIRLTQITRI